MSDQELDLGAVLMSIEPGYVVVEDGHGSSKLLFVPPPMSIGGGVQASLGFELDGQDGVLGKHVFLHRRMNIRHLGSLEEYCADSFVRSLLPHVVPFLDQSLGALPVIAVIEALRIEPEANLPALVTAILERRKGLREAAEQG